MWLVNNVKKADIKGTGALFTVHKFQKKPFKGVSKTSFPRPTFSNSKDIVCHYYHKKGHIQPDCHKCAKDCDSGIFRSIKPPSQVTREATTSIGRIQLFSSTVLCTTTIDCDFSNTWYLDSGATRHMTPHFKWFVSYSKLDPPLIVSMADNAEQVAIGMGTVNLQLSTGHHTTVSNVRAACS